MIVDLPSVDVVAARAEWCAALRSGDYAQARHALRVEDGFCCLGVAEDLARGRDAWVLPTDAQRGNAFTGMVVWAVPCGGASSSSRVELSTLTRSTRERLGLVDHDPIVVVPSNDADSCALHDCPCGDPFEVLALSALNDGGRYDLAAIAAVIDDQAPDWNGSLERAERDAARRGEAVTTGTSA